MTEEEIKIEKSKYTRKIEIPIYEPKNKKPLESELMEISKVEELLNDINADTDIPDELRKVLVFLAYRHTTFNFSKIADYYAHSPLKYKKYFEDTAAVIIDYDEAIKKGFVAYERDVYEVLEEYKGKLNEDELLKNLKDVTDKNKKKEIIEKITSDISYESEEW